MARFISQVHRFFLPPDLAIGDVLTLSAEESHHAANVLRVRIGEAAIVLDGAGKELRGGIESITKRAVAIRVHERFCHPRRAVELHLAVALLKGPAWDVVMEKATELGAAVIQPLAAERSIPRIASKETSPKRAGWRATTIAAAKQCGTPWLPRLSNPLSPEAWLSSWGHTGPRLDLLLVASLESGTRSIRAAMAEFFARHGRRPQSVAVVVGPEGDFTPAEYGKFREFGAMPFTLGPLVLRADTAVVAALAIAGAEFSSLPLESEP